MKELAASLFHHNFPPTLTFRQVRGERRAGMGKASPEQVMVVLESGLARWFEQQGVEIE
jgi:hypothetical protein